MSKKKAWKDKSRGVVLPHGTALCVEYKKEQRYGSIVEGEFAFGFERFDKPTVMARAVARDIVGDEGRISPLIS